MNWGQSESKQKHCSLSLFIAPSLSLLLFAQTNERAGEEGGGSLECRDRKCVLAERAVRASCRRSTLRHAIKHTHSTDMDHLDELSFLQHAGPGMLFSQRRVKEQLQILSFSSFLSSLALFFFTFQLIILPSSFVIHTQTVWLYRLWTNYIITAVPSLIGVVPGSLRSIFIF